MAADPPLLVTWPATPDDVAALLRARTQDNTDLEAGAWSVDTRPTLAEVERLLAMATAVVLGQTGDLTQLPCTTAEDIRTQAATGVALLAAMLVELSYFPEQVNSSRSAYQQYQELFWGTDSRGGMLAMTVQAAAECLAGAVEADAEEGAKEPSWAFPVDVGGMVGWQTKW